MKKCVSIFLCVVMLLCVFSFNLPSFALSYNGFSYEIQKEKIVITGYAGSDKNLTIPAEIDGKFVVKIENNAFKDNENLTSVAISEGIEDVGESVFENCTSLATISLPSTITHIGKNAIFNTAYYNDKSNWKLKRIEDDTNINIGSGNQDSIEWEDVLAPTLQYLYLGTALIECEFSGTYQINPGTTVVADYAFSKSAQATRIIFPTNTIYAGNYAFDGCVSLNEIEMGENVIFESSTIYNTGFYNNSENWENNGLYMGTHLVATKGDEVIIKTGTTQIISGAINSKSVVIPKSVTEIQENALVNTENTTIFGYADTCAQSFANENNIKFIDLESISKGDVNFDGELSGEDYKILCDISTLQQIPSFAVVLAGDMNEDGTIDGLDVVILDLFLKDIGPSTIKGDADGNGEVNEADYALLVKIATLNTEITDVYMHDRCDLNYDGAVDNFDAVYLDLALNGLVALI